MTSHSSSSMAKASLEQLQDAKNALSEPLTGKQVMVPMTSKAFFAGSLQPTITNDGGGKEQVLVNLGRQDFVQLNREEALSVINDRIKEVEDEKISQKEAPSVAKVTPPRPSASNDGGQASFFEIREEYDDKGREIRSEAIDVAKELQYLEQQKGGRGSSDTSPRASERSMDSNEPDTSFTIQEEQSPQRPISDQEYDTLSARLDELARLEEQESAKKQANARSEKKLQGSGWNKGFLNSKPKTKRSATKTTPNEANSTAASGRRGPTAEDRTRTVAFGENEMKEIPRIGKRSVADLKPPPPTVSERKGFEPEIFSGLIQERMPTATTNVPGNAGRPQRAQKEPKKRISKFAMERQQQRE